VTIWLVSDTHFGHERMITTFKDANGQPARRFSSVEEMDETMVERWNSRVKPADHVWHLGDVAMSRPVMDRILPRLRGHKRLIRGNHDVFKTAAYAKWFEEIAGYRVFGVRGQPRAGGVGAPAIICSHIPLHPDSVKKGWVNVHGHTHLNSLPDARYLNICVEQTAYAPVALEEIDGLWRAHRRDLQTVVGAAFSTEDHTS
jgi:calcineurin-like phosphoesterase family protein